MPDISPLDPPPPPPPPPPLSRAVGEGPVALFLDFDGTLVNIADAPDAIVVPADLAARLEALAVRLDGRLAIVTGRAPDDLRGHLGAFSLFLAGSHGAAVSAPDGSTLGAGAGAFPDAAKAAVADYARTHELLYEAKAHGAGLHYRAHPDRRDAAVDHMEELAEKYDLAVKTGKQVIELVRPGADKGQAVERLMAQPAFAGGTPIFLGDDVTDEDGFTACARLGGYGVLVGEGRDTAARYRLASVADVHAWLTL